MSHSVNPSDSAGANPGASAGANPSAEERRAIADRVSQVSANILLWREVPVPTLTSVDLMAERVRELTKESLGYSRVVDLSESARPRAEVRRRLRDMLNGEDRLDHLAVFTLRNTLINVALKFVLSGMSKNISISVHQTFDEALQACERRRSEAK